MKNQDAVLKLAVSTLDYSRDGLARVILSKILTAATDVRQTQQQEDMTYKHKNTYKAVIEKAVQFHKVSAIPDRLKQ